MNLILNMKNAKKLLFLIILTFLFNSFSSFSQQILQNDYKVLGLSVEGNISAEPETIIGLAGIYQGDIVKYPGDEKFQSAIRNLWKRGQFQEIRIVADRITADGIFLKIIVKEFPRLNRINITGNKKLSEKEIQTSIAKTRGDIIKPYDLSLIEKRIKKTYFDEGLQYTKINSTLTQTDSISYMNLNVEVDEGVKFYAKAVEFVGNKYYSNEELEKVFDDTHIKKWWQFWRSAKFNPDKYEEDKALLKDFYKKEGFMDFSFLKDTLIFDEKEGEVIVRVFIEEGERFYLRDVNFTGNTIYKQEHLFARLDMKKGDVMNREKFEFNLQGNQEQTDAMSLYMDNGYLQVAMTPNYKQVGDSVDIEIVVRENDRYKIGRVDVVGNTKTREKVIRRELYTRPGDYFDRSSIINSIRALGVTGFFNPETLQPDIQPSKEDKSTVDLTYKVEERSNDQANIQLGYAGTYGLTLTLGLMFNNFCIDDPFTSGAGQATQISFEVGQWDRYRMISVNFMEPWLLDKPTTVGFGIFHQYYNYTSWKLSRTGFSANLGRRFRWPDNYFRGDWNWRTQYNDIRDAQTSAYYRPGTYWENTITQTFSRTNWNHSFFPSVGSSFELTSSLSLGSIGIGSTDFFKNELRYQFVSPLWKYKGVDKVVLYVESRFGYITGIKSDTAMSPVELYHMGGNGLGMYNVIPLRGYDDDALGYFYDPAEGTSMHGGRSSAKFAAELRFSIAMDPMPIYVYGFAEAGNLWKDLKTVNPMDMKRSAGVGIQLMIPQLGNIGFSYGYGFDALNMVGPSGSMLGRPSGWKFLFHLGGM
jgi:outer membrane protein insertion porin family